MHKIQWLAHSNHLLDYHKQTFPPAFGLTFCKTFFTSLGSTYRFTLHILILLGCQIIIIPLL